VKLLNEIQVGILDGVRAATSCKVGKDDEGPTVKRTLTLSISAPKDTAEELTNLFREGAAVYIVAGTRQHKLPVE